MDIIGVGESDIDVFIKIEKLAGTGEKTKGQEIGKFPGGIIGNFCSAVSMHGLDTGIVTVLGDDENGKEALKDYKKRNIDISNLSIKNGGKTFYCIIFLDSDGERTLTAVVTPLISPNYKEIDYKYLKKAKYVHMTSMDYDLVNEVTMQMRQSKTKLTLDFEAHAEKEGFNNWKSILKDINVLFINEGGMNTLFPNQKDINMAAKQILDIGIEYIVYTKGEKGGIVFTKDRNLYYQAYKVDNIKDTTGAGDCFNASFLSALIKRKPLEEVVRYAAASSALSIQHIGARTGLPNPEQVDKFIQNYNHDIIY